MSSRSVSLVLSLPAEIADEVERVQQSDPEFLEQVVAYGMLRRAVFDRLRGVIAPRRPSASSYEAG